MDVKRISSRERAGYADAYKLLGKRDEVIPGMDMVAAVCCKSVVGWRGTEFLNGSPIECNEANKEKLLIETRFQTGTDKDGAPTYESAWTVIERLLLEKIGTETKN